MSLLRRNVQKSFQLLRQYSKTAENAVEVKIPVPWGHVAGKWWGSQSKRPILVLHGYQDNCGSFDRLLPELSEDHSFLAIDLPGHGLSSYIPKGMFYGFLNGPLLVKQIADYFQWPKISLMGHSMGGMICFGYASYLPNTVDLLICIDGFLPVVLPNYTQRNGDLIEKYIKYTKLNDSNTEPPSFTMQELANKLHEGTKKSIDIDKCQYILQRTTAPSKTNPGKYYFSMDQRLKAGPHFQGVPHMFGEDIDRLKCPVFLSIPDGSPFYKEKYRKFVEKYLNQMRTIPSNEVHLTAGTHHVHLNDPSDLQGLIRSFLAKYDVEDRSVGGISKEMLSML